MAKKFKRGKRDYEASPADRRQDKREAKKRGMSMAKWENSAADKAQDAARPGPNVFSPDQEQQMRAGNRQQRNEDDADSLNYGEDMLGLRK
jgi:hypothetical protein